MRLKLPEGKSGGIALRGRTGLQLLPGPLLRLIKSCSMVYYVQ